MKKKENEMLLRKIEGTSKFKVGDRVKFKSETSKNARYFMDFQNERLEKNLIIKSVIKFEDNFVLADLNGTRAKYGYRVGGDGKKGGFNGAFNVMEEELELELTK
jgi:hypothetical protein